MQVQGKIALITGAAHRVGKAIALKLAQHGAHIGLNYHHSVEAAQATQAELRALGVEVLLLPADVSDAVAVENMVAQAMSHFGQIDILVNNAASFQRALFLNMSLSQWDEVLGLNLRGPFICAKAVAPHMLKLTEGTIINLTDLSGVVPTRGRVAHSVAKAGLISLTEALAIELRPTIRVNGIAPGPVLAPTQASEAVKARKAERTLLKRWGEADHVAQTVLFLVENDYITGEIIRVDGGELLAWRDI